MTIGVLKKFSTKNAIIHARTATANSNKISKKKTYIGGLSLCIRDCDGRNKIKKAGSTFEGRYF
jgi:hypothetical protein